MRYDSIRDIGGARRRRTRSSGWLMKKRKSSLRFSFSLGTRHHQPSPRDLFDGWNFSTSDPWKNTISSRALVDARDTPRRFNERRRGKRAFFFFTEEGSGKGVASTWVPPPSPPSSSLTLGCACYAREPACNNTFTRQSGDIIQEGV